MKYVMESLSLKVIFDSACLIKLSKLVSAKKWPSLYALTRTFYSDVRCLSEVSYVQYY
jgi:hypothetical protein